MGNSVFDLNKSQRNLLEQMKDSLVHNKEAKDARITLITSLLSDGRMVKFQFVLEPFGDINDAKPELLEE